MDKLKTGFYWARHRSNPDEWTIIEIINKEDDYDYISCLGSDEIYSLEEFHEIDPRLILR